MILDYKHSATKNCGSGALTNISRFWGNNLDESIVFGLACGLSFAILLMEALRILKRLMKKT